MSSRFGAYEILYELKAGGMGAVLLGRRRGPGAFEQVVAIKTIRAEYAQAAAVRAMFLDEAAILARLNHPGIAHVHDFGEEGGTLYMVMEYVAGIALRDLIRVPPIVVARAIAEAARGLHAAHEVRDLAGHPMGLVHRDISPDNLMLGFDGHVKVIDFGIALVKNRQAPVTEFGTVKGKPPYMSPEQVKNEAIDRRSDVFSLAVVAWEMLTGRSLFEGDSIYAVALAVEKQPIEPPSRVRGEALPFGLDAAVMNALDRDLSRRTPTAAALAESLEQVVQSAGGESLSAWTERELREAHEAHRAWMAQVATGATQLPKLEGRSTSQVTQVAPVGGGELAVTPIAHVEAPDPGTSIGRDTELDVPRRRRLGPLVAVLLLVLAAGGIAVYMMARPREAPRPRDAAIDAIPVAPPPPVDAASDAAFDATGFLPAPIDAGPPPIDAGRGHTVRPRRDAGGAPPGPGPGPDAAAPSGTGYFTAVHKGSVYLDIIVDGRKIGVTPMLRPHPIPAGRHTIELVMPDTGQVVAHRTVDVTDGLKLEIAPP